MPISVIPSTIPKPATYAYTDAGLASTSGLPGAHYALSRSSEPVGEAEVTFFMSPVQVEAFLAWWKTELYFGGCWFGCDWMTPRGNATVAKFLGEPNFRHAGNGAFYVTISALLRGDANAVYMPCLEGPTWAASSVTGDYDQLTIPRYGNGVFAVGGIRLGISLVLYSTDLGATWNRTLLGNYGGYMARLCFANGYFMADIVGSNVAFSADGANWAAYGVTSQDSTATIAWGGNGWFFRLAGSGTSFARLQRFQLNGANDSGVVTLSMPFDRMYAGGCYGNGVNIAWGANGACYSLDDGVTWSVADTSAGWPGHALSVTHSPKGFVAVARYAGSGTYVGAFSSDGRVWTPIYNATSGIWRGYTYAKSAHTIFGRNQSGIWLGPYVFTSLSPDSGYAPAANGYYVPAAANGYSHFAGDGRGNVVGTLELSTPAIGYGTC